MKTVASLKRFDVVTLTSDCATMAANFKVGDTFRFLGTFNGTLIRVSRIGDSAKLITEPIRFGLVDEQPKSAPVALAGTELEQLTKAANEAYVAFHAATLNAPKTPEFQQLRSVFDNLRVAIVSAKNAIRVQDDAKYDAPHADESGPSRRIVTATVLAGPHSGELAIHLTPAEEREYNAGMARMAELG